jgi:solute carrier family 45 protein 1/2/4
VYAIFCIDFSINAGKVPSYILVTHTHTIAVVQAVDRALLVDILPPTLQAAGNAWAGRMFGLGSVAGFFIGGVNLPRAIPWLGRTQLEVLSIVSSVLLLGLHGITAGAVEEKVLVTDGLVWVPTGRTVLVADGKQPGALRMAMCLCEYLGIYGIISLPYPERSARL